MNIPALLLTTSTGMYFSNRPHGRTNDGAQPQPTTTSFRRLNIHFSVR
jgi:hypothetical protein